MEILSITLFIGEFDKIYSVNGSKNYSEIMGKKIGKIVENKERFDIFDTENVLLTSIKALEYQVFYKESINQVSIKEPKKKNVFSKEVTDLTEYFIDNLKLNNPKFSVPSSLDRWNKEMDLLIRKDGLTSGEVVKLIDFCQSDSFWKGVILSVPKLREKKDTLLVRMKTQYRPLDKLKEIAMGGNYGSTGSGKSHIFDFNEL